MSVQQPQQPQQDRKLVILCLHGFRQNASQFRGRLRALQRKLASVATLVFVDAPHVLPLWYKEADTQQGIQQSCPQQHQQPDQHPSLQDSKPQTFSLIPNPKRAWLLSEELLEAQPQLQAFFKHSQHQQQQLQPTQETGVHFPAQPGTAGCQGTCTHQHQQNGLPPALLPQQEQQGHVWSPAPAHALTPGQLNTQACGWEASWKVILSALAGSHSMQQQGQQQHLVAIDGILGFSQGAAVAAAVAAVCQQQQRQQHPGGDIAEAVQLRFVILASGFVSPVSQHQVLLEQQKPLQLPSLHVYASKTEGGSDRQVQQQMSEQLLALFEEDGRQVITHSTGHMIPCDAASIAQIKAFLQQFQ